MQKVSPWVSALTGRRYDHGMFLGSYVSSPLNPTDFRAHINIYVPTEDNPARIATHWGRRIKLGPLKTDWFWHDLRFEDPRTPYLCVSFGRYHTHVEPHVDLKDSRAFVWYNPGSSIPPQVVTGRGFDETNTAYISQQQADESGRVCLPHLYSEEVSKEALAQAINQIAGKEERKKRALQLGKEDIEAIVEAAFNETVSSNVPFLFRPVPNEVLAAVKPA